MTLQQFKASTTEDFPPESLSTPLAALWWDARGDWSRAHSLVDELSTRQGMAVHAYLHRKEGSDANANYWYQRAGDEHRRNTLDAEWTSLVEALLSEG